MATFEDIFGCIYTVVCKIMNANISANALSKIIEFTDK